MKTKLENTEKLLKKWNGSKAKLWFYKVSFSELIIRVEKPNKKGNLHIHCINCTSIIMPKVSWNKCNIQIEIIKEDKIVGSTFMLFDKLEGVEIICMGIHFVENVEPIY